MFRFYARLAALLIVPVLAVILLAKALGAAQPPHPVLVGFIDGCEEQSRPCWYGIVLGVTTPEDAIYRLAGGDSGLATSHFTSTYNVLLRPPDETQVCVIQMRVENNLLDAMSLVYCDANDLRVGDLAAFIGAPDRVQSLFDTVYYGRDNAIRGVTPRWSWFDSVTTINLYDPTAAPQ